MLKIRFISLLLFLIISSSLYAWDNKPIPTLSYKLDIPLGILSIGTALAGSYFIQETEIPENIKDKSDLLPWDKPFAGVYSSTADLWSDILNGGLLLPLAISGYAFYQNDVESNAFASALVMYAEALALQSGINLFTRSFQVWPRPYLYHSEKKEKAKGEAYGSFYSGHASAAFTGAVFSSYLFEKIYPHSKFNIPIKILSFSLATSVAVLRVAAGKHYPTDVFVGALAGTGISLGVIALHEKFSSNVAIVPTPQGAMLSVLF